MYLLNLSFLQAAAIFGMISAVSVALYLLDRSRRRQVVSTFRFWTAAEQPATVARRRHIQQPWSLILQLISMALLILAIAQLRFGTAAQAGRDHVILLDTSAWMAARSGNRTLMDVARDRARQYLRSLPSRDRAMLVRADGLATPATAFEPDRHQIEAAIQASRPGSTALNLDQALAFARHIQAQKGRRPGEIAFIGAGRVAEGDTAVGAPPRNLRYLPITDSIQNSGLRKIGVRRSTADSDLWEVYVSAHNYGTQPKTVTLSLDFGPPGRIGRVAAGSRSLLLQPGTDTEASFPYRTAAAGILGVTLTPHDAFPADDHAELELPSQPMLPVVVYTTEPDLLRPALSSNSRVAATYRKPEEYRADDKALVILDRFIPSQRPAGDSIWIDPPSQGSPIPIRSTAEQVPLLKWDTAHPAAAGLRTKDFKLEHVSIFETAPTDGRIAEVAAGPMIVARDGKPKIVVFGFHPGKSAMRYEVATPLLFANLLRWVSPEIFRRWEVGGGSVGAVKLEMDQDTAVKDIKVTAEDGSSLPFTLRDRTLNFFAGSLGSVRVVAGDREYIYSLTLPQLWDTKWTPPADVRQGIPRFTGITEEASDIWPVLAVLGMLGLLTEWWLYGRFRRGRATTRPILMQSRSGAKMEATRP